MPFGHHDRAQPLGMETIDRPDVPRKPFSDAVPVFLGTCIAVVLLPIAACGLVLRAAFRASVRRA